MKNRYLLGLCVIVVAVMVLVVCGSTKDEILPEFQTKSF